MLSGVESAGYAEPTPIQERSIPIALDGHDLLGLAQTGTGKTAAFVLPILNRLSKNTRHTEKQKAIKALIVVPTRELADQVNQAIEDYGQYTEFNSITIYGGVNKNPQDDKLAIGTDIVVACPGRLLDHIRERSIDLSSVDILVIDEADTMCDMGFLPDVRRILEHLPKPRQTLFFAATMPPEIRELTSDILDRPKTIQIGIIAPAKTVSHALYPTTDKIKKRMIMHLLERTATGQVMIFTRTKRRARFLAEDLEKTGFRVAPLQGNMSQNKRQKAIDGFRKGKYDILVATDLASRGIDVSEVTHVINFDMPNTVDTYIHRIGRTGRAHNQGEAFTFCVHEDEALIRKVERVLGNRIERRKLDDFDYGGYTPTLSSPEETSSRNRARTSRSISPDEGRQHSNKQGRFKRRRPNSPNGRGRSSIQGRENNGIPRHASRSDSTSHDNTTGTSQPKPDALSRRRSNSKTFNHKGKSNSQGLGSRRNSNRGRARP